VTTTYELTLSEDVRVAQRQSAACKQVLEAAEARAAGDSERAVALYGDVLKRPESPLVPHVKRWRNEAHLEWASRLRSRGDHERAIRAYRQFEADSGDAASVKGMVADTYVEWGDQLRSKRTPASYNKAIDIYRRLGESGDAVRAKGRIVETYMELGDNLRSTSDYKGAITQYGAVLTQFADFPASADAARSGLAGIVEAARAPIASGKPCGALPILEALAAADEPFRGQASTLMPGTMFSCGEQSQREGRVAEAMTQFRSVRERFPDSDVAARAETALIDAEIAAAGGGASSLPPPQRTGSARGRSAVMIIRNASRRPIEVLVSGPSSKRITLAPCGDCGDAGIAPTACRGNGPQVEVALGAGEYKALAKVTDGTKVTPFTGTWTLSSSSRYTHCLYIVSRF